MSHTMMINEITPHYKKEQPFDREQPIRLFVGTSENFDHTIERVYLYSILKNTNILVVLLKMKMIIIQMLLGNIMLAKV